MQRSGFGLAAVVAVTALLAAGCAAPGDSTRPGASPQTTTASAGSTPSIPSPTSSRSTTTATSAATPTSSRTLLPVPAVKPPGFVVAPRGRGVQRYLDQDVIWRACGRLQCADVRVPLDWSKPDGQAITLRVGRRAATASPRLGSLFVNPGGPGGSGVQLAANLDRDGLEQYDVVGWDPRGAGSSTPVVCQDARAMDDYYATDFSPDSTAEDKAWLAANAKLARSCLARSGSLLEHISTLDTVKDLDFLRQLLGNKKLNYLGYSYGTEIGAVYANAYPLTVGRMVLDGAVDITGTDPVSQAIGFERALGAFADWCARRADCHLGLTKAAVQRSVVALLKATDAQPLKVGDRTMTQALVVTGLVRALYYDDRIFPYLGHALAEARAGRGAMLLALADDYNGRDENGQYGSLLTSYFAISCTEETGTVAAARSRAAVAEKDAPVIGPYFGVDYTCTQWPVPPAPPLPRLVAKGAAPIVVIGTTNDPATPYEQAVSMAKQLDSGRLLTLKGEGHTAYGRNSCINRNVQRYLADGKVPADRTSCG